MVTSWSGLPSKAKVFISLVCCLAIPLLAFAVRDLLFTDLPAILISKSNYQGLILAAVALITVPVFVFLPSPNALVTIGDALIISICMLSGRSTAVVANALYISFIAAFLRSKYQTATYRLVFNVAMAVVNVSLYGSVYYILAPPKEYRLEIILLPAFCVAATFFLSNSIFVATAIGLSDQKRITKVWAEDFSKRCLDFLVSASAGTLIVWTGRSNPWLPLPVATIVGFFWLLYKTNREKTLDAQRHLREQEQLYERTVESLALAVDAKDQTTYGHIRRVRAYANGLAKLSGITDLDILKAIETGSLLHDIGKLAIEDYILNKPGPLSKVEFEKMKVHAAAGDEILKRIKFPFKVKVEDCVRHHHECWDGKGYPDGLRGKEIPLGARILAIADAFDAIRSTRPYKVSAGTLESIEILRSHSGTRYDPALVEIFIAHIGELELSAEEAASNMTELSFRKYFEKVDRDIAQDTADTQMEIQRPTTSSELVRLAEFCGSVGRQLDLQDSLPILGRRLQKLIPFTTCAFYLDDGEGKLHIVHACGKFAETLHGFNTCLGKGISGWVAAYMRPMINARPALEFHDLTGNFDVYTDSIAVPLMVEGQSIGAIGIYAEHPIIYNRLHLDLLQTASKLISPLIAELQSRKGAYSNAEQLDSVTRTPHASYLSVVGDQLIAQAEQSKSPLSLIAIDIYNLRQIINFYGSAAGDSLMRRTADIVKAELRDSDIVVRYGHQAFMALLNGVRLEQATRCAQRLQMQIRSSPLSEIPGHSVFAGCRIAVSSFPTNGVTIQDLIFSAHEVITEQAKIVFSSDATTGTNIVEFPPRA